MEVIGSNYTVRYPDVAMVFNSIAIEIESSYYKYARFTYNGVVSEINIINDIAKLEISGFCKSMFDRDSLGDVRTADLATYKPEFVGSLELIYRSSAGSSSASIVINIALFWGALMPQDTLFSYNGKHNYWYQRDRLVYFEGYPFTIPLYVIDGSLTYKYVFDGEQSEITLPQGNTRGKYNIPIENFSFEERLIIAGYDERYNTNNIFTSVFDHTFRGISKYVFNYIDISVCNRNYREPVYLRWIDQRGDVRYYLFETFSESDSVNVSDVSVYDNRDSDVYKWSGYRYTGKVAQNYKTLGIQWIEKDRYPFIQSLFRSVHVDMLVGYNDPLDEDEPDFEPIWLNVKVNSGNYTRDRKNIDSYLFNMYMPEPIIQSL